LMLDLRSSGESAMAFFLAEIAAQLSEFTSAFCPQNSREELDPANGAKPLYGGIACRLCGEEICEHPRSFLPDGGLISPGMIQLAEYIDSHITAGVDAALDRAAEFIEGKAKSMEELGAFNESFPQLLRIYAAQIREFKLEREQQPIQQGENL
jgi:hypothetical protein